MEFQFYGNNKARELLSRSLNQNHLAHAYLFSGERGIGKRTLATEFAMGILCGESPRPCHSCPSCRKVGKNIHPDFQILDGGKRKNSFHVKEVRALRSDAYVQPNDGAYKVFLLNYVEQMSAEAANSLLKVLEEPPAPVVFLLTCSSVSAILPTLASRCIQVPLFPVTDDQCRQALEQSLPDTEPGRLDLAVSLSGGVIGAGRRLLEDPDCRRALDVAAAVRSALLKRDELDLILALSPLENDRNAAYLALNLLERMVERDLRQKVEGTSTPQLPRKQLLSLARLIQSIREKLDQNANLRLALAWFSSSAMDADMNWR